MDRRLPDCEVPNVPVMSQQTGKSGDVSLPSEEYEQLRRGVSAYLTCHKDPNEILPGLQQRLETLNVDLKRGWCGWRAIEVDGRILIYPWFAGSAGKFDLPGADKIKAALQADFDMPQQPKINLAKKSQNS